MISGYKMNVLKKCGEGAWLCSQGCVRNQPETVIPGGPDVPNHIWLVGLMWLGAG